MPLFQPGISAADAATLVYNNFVLGNYPGVLNLVPAGDDFAAIFQNDTFTFKLFVSDDGIINALDIEVAPPVEEPGFQNLPYLQGGGGGGGGEASYMGGGSFGSYLGGWGFWGGGGGGATVTVHEAEHIQLV
jgi:hypothetical protein